MTYSQDQHSAAWRPRSTDDLDPELTTELDDDAELSDPEAEPADDTELRDPKAAVSDPEAEPADDTELGDPKAAVSDPEAEPADDAELGDPKAELRDPQAAPPAELDDDIIVAEVIEESPRSLNADGPSVADTDPELPRATTGEVSTKHGGAGLSQRWRDIQVSFVDDPRGAVRLAAEAADAAVAALVTSLHERQSAVLSAASDADDAQDTEQLRTALQGYRMFCQNIEQLGHQLPEPDPLSR